MKSALQRRTRPVKCTAAIRTSYRTNVAPSLTSLDFQFLKCPFRSEATYSAATTETGRFSTSIVLKLTGKKKIENEEHIPISE